MRSNFSAVSGRNVTYCLSIGQAREWACTLASKLPGGTFIALHGDLGSGKTTLARALCEGFGITDHRVVTSPTYSIVQEYEAATGRIVHADFYRIRDGAELVQLGWEELVAQSALTIVEWAERYPDAIPENSLHIHLEHAIESPEVRRITIPDPDRFPGLR